MYKTMTTDAKALTARHLATLQLRIGHIPANYLSYTDARAIRQYLAALQTHLEKDLPKAPPSPHERTAKRIIRQAARFIFAGHENAIADGHATELPTLDDMETEVWLEAAMDLHAELPFIGPSRLKRMAAAELDKLYAAYELENRDSVPGSSL